MSPRPISQAYGHPQISAYHLRNGAWPKTIADYVEQRDVNGHWYSDENSRVQRLLHDPWENEYYYEYLDGEDHYILLSFGADGDEGGEGFDADIYGSGG